MRSFRVVFGLAALGALLVLVSCHPETSAQAAQGTLRAPTVQVSRLVTKVIQPQLEMNGTLKADQDVVVKAETQGRIVALPVVVGDRVAPGQTLALVDDVIKRATAEANRANLAKLRKDLDRITLLRSQNVSSDTDVDNVRLAVVTAESQAAIAVKDLDNTQIRAPFGGVVTERLLSLGAMVSPGTPVVHVISLDTLKVLVNINQRDILEIHQGDPVEVVSDVNPGLAIPGTVRAISPQAQSAQNFPVEIRVQNRGRQVLYDGMSVVVRFRFPERSVQTIPRAALTGSVQEPKVFVVQERKASLRSIRIGGQHGTDLEVIGGLSNDDEVVISGQNTLLDGAAVEVVP